MIRDHNLKTLILRYSPAIALAFVALLVEILVRHLIPEASPFLLFFGAITLSAWWGGWQSGILTTVICALFADYFFLSPVGSLFTSTTHQTLHLGLFALDGIAISLLSASLHRVRRYAEAKRIQSFRDQEKSKESEERFRLLVEGVHDYAICMLDPAGMVVSWNAGARRITGYESREITGKHFACFYTPEDTAQGMPARQLEVAIQHGKVEDEGWRVRKDCSQFWANVVITALRDDAGQLRGFAMVTRDISERQVAQKALKNSEMRLAGIINSAMDAIISVDQDLKVVLFNLAAQKMFGCSEKEALGQPLEQFLPERYRGTNAVYLHTTSENGATTRRAMQAPGTLIARRSNGEEFPIEATISSLSLEQETLLTVILRDITDRKQAETRTTLLQDFAAALSKAVTLQEVTAVISQQVVRLFKGHANAVYLLSDDGAYLDFLHHDGAPVNIQDPAERISLDAHLPMSDAVRTGQIVAIRTAAEYGAFYRQLCPKTQIRAMIALPLVVNNRIIGGIGANFLEEQTFGDDERAFWNIVAQQCAQAIERARLYSSEQQARLEAERANQIKLQFLGMISHELRTPLTPLKGFITTLLQDDVTYDAATQRSFLEVMNQEADKLTHLVEQLLELSRLQAGTFKVSPQPLLVYEIMEIARTQLKAITTQHPLVIQDVDCLPVVCADAHRVAQVIVNLVSNAAKYSPPGTPIAASMVQEDGFVRVNVIDQGVGIPASDKPHVFEAFRQVDRKDGRAIKGAGLGLAICKGIIEAHGGSIWIEDNAPSGTVISFTLPIFGEEEAMPVV